MCDLRDLREDADQVSNSQIFISDINTLNLSLTVESESEFPRRTRRKEHTMYLVLYVAEWSQVGTNYCFV